MDKVLIKDLNTGMYVKLIDVSSTICLAEWEIVSADEATGLMNSEAQSFIKEHNDHSFEIDEVNCKTNYIVETEEQANEVFFAEVNPPSYYYDGDFEDDFHLSIQDERNMYGMHVLYSNKGYNESNFLVLKGDRHVVDCDGLSTWEIEQSGNFGSFGFMEWFSLSNTVEKTQ
ncbi:hypothetical protein CJF42_07545 [Pseudoalteromonas sp. NBT06-2]|uniref:hypothetical protein n=1 Tax=Pseudoalteromonas sp. NBT06-2 TaxID=2025950 RepID=UPI000BA58E6C|nr:hypothetical protein [Pseudoalteromonas sp. NBT06-2]PAJ75054.1 hypothetical protein CJF42_07545 [Pseudoalteromonas sp. NBT06-2]